MVDSIHEVTKLADDVNMIIRRSRINVRGCDIRAAVETSSRRRDHLRMKHQSRELLAQLNPGFQIGVCARAL